MKVDAWTLPALVFLAFPLQSASAQEPSSAGFGEVMTVTEIQVPVQVFADGEPVRGLRAADFEVYDDGVRRELSAFEVVDLSSDATREAGAETEGSADAHRSLLVLFDFAFNHPKKLARALVGVDRMVAEQLHPKDRVAIATFDLGRGVTFLSGFSTDREESRAALAQLERMIAGASIEISPFGAVLARAHAGEPVAVSGGALETLSAQLGATAALALGGRSPGFTTPALTQLTEREIELLKGDVVEAEHQDVLAQIAASDPAAIAASYVEDAGLRMGISATRSATEAFSELVTLLRGVSGQKHFLYLSGGLPAAVATQQAVAKAMEEMFRAFKASAWKLQAIDVNGVPDAFGGGSPGDPIPGTVGFASDSLVNAARGTGGDVYENFSDISQATRRVIEKTRVTYLLTFAVANPPDDGRYHRLEVRLKAPIGARLLHREGYYNPLPLAKRTSLERRLDAAEEILGEAVGGDFEAKLLVTALAGRGNGQVALWLEVPGTALSNKRRTGKVSARLEAFLIDDEERFASSGGGHLELDLEAVGERLEAGGLKIFLPLMAPPGEHRLRLRLVEEGGGGSWLGTAAVSVPEASGTSRVLSPIFPEPFPTGVVARLGGEGKNPFRFGERELVPRVSGSCRPGERLPVLLFIDGEGTGAGLSAQLLDADGKAVAGERLTWLAREERDESGLERLFGAVDCSGLLPGAYWLEAGLQVGKGVSPATASRAPFTVLQP